MKKFSIKVPGEKNTASYEVIDYALDDLSGSCKFEVRIDGKTVASFEPDRHGFLHICKNPGNLPEPVLHLIAEKIESFHF